MLCILYAVFQLRALLYVLCAFVILNKDYLLTYLSMHCYGFYGVQCGYDTGTRPILTDRMHDCAVNPLYHIMAYTAYVLHARTVGH